jgi:hypothetical protein
MPAAADATAAPTAPAVPRPLAPPTSKAHVVKLSYADLLSGADVNAQVNAA